MRGQVAYGSGEVSRADEVGPVSLPRNVGREAVGPWSGFFLVADRRKAPPETSGASSQDPASTRPDMARDSADGTEFRILRWGGYCGLPRWGPCSHRGPQKRRRCEHRRREGEPCALKLDEGPPHKE